MDTPTSDNKLTAILTAQRHNQIFQKLEAFPVISDARAKKLSGSRVLKLTLNRRKFYQQNILTSLKP